MVVQSPSLMVSFSRRSKGVLGGSVVELRKVPLQESRSRMVHLPDTDSIMRCLDEMPSSLMVTSLPRTIRPIRILDPGLNSMVSPERGPRTMISFIAGGSMNVVLSPIKCVIEMEIGIHTLKFLNFGQAVEGSLSVRFNFQNPHAGRVAVIH